MATFPNFLLLRRSLILCGLGLCAYLATFIAPVVASFFLVTSEGMGRTGVGYSAYTVGNETLEASRNGNVYNIGLLAPGILSSGTNRKTSTKSSKKKSNNKSASKTIYEQRRILETLEQQERNARLLKTMGEDNLLLMLKTEFSAQSYMLNKWLRSSFNDERAADTLFTNLAQDKKLAVNITLKAPKVIDLSNTASIEAIIDWTFENKESAPKVLPVIEADLESPDFKIASGKPKGQTIPIANTEPKRQAWVWLISPEKLGDRKLSLSFRNTTNQPIPILNGAMTKGYNVVISINVLTELGLTSTQNAWAKALAAIATIIGTIAGYSFWKHRTQKKNSEDDPDPDLELEDSEEGLDVQDAQIILKELARHLREQQTNPQDSGEIQVKAQAAPKEGQGDNIADPPNSIERLSTSTKKGSTQ